MKRWLLSLAALGLVIGCGRSRPPQQPWHPQSWGPSTGWPAHVPYGPPVAPPSIIKQKPATTFANTPTKPVDPVATRVDLDTAGFAAETQRVLVKLRGTNGEQLWACERTKQDAGRVDTACPLPPAWTKTKGRYTVWATFDGGAPPVTRTFHVTGEELGIDVAVAHDRIDVTRILPAPAEVRLERGFMLDWSPLLPLRYRLVNGSSKVTIEAGAIKGHYFGTLEKQTDGGWTTFTRGVICDASHGYEQLSPGASATALEGHFVGGLRKLVPGRYRFRLLYREVGSDAAGTIVVRELRDEIYIPQHGKTPLDPNVDCDPPYSIDRHGIRRVREQCL